MQTWHLDYGVEKLIETNSNKTDIKLVAITFINGEHVEKWKTYDSC